MTSKIVIVSGGTSGMGRATAMARLARGDLVTAIGSSEEKGRALLAEAGTDRLTFLRADLSSVAEVERVVADIAARHDRVDALTLFANRASPRPVATADGLERTFALYYLSRHLLGSGRWKQPRHNSKPRSQRSAPSSPNAPTKPRPATSSRCRAGATAMPKPITPSTGTPRFGPSPRPVSPSQVVAPERHSGLRRPVVRVLGPGFLELLVDVVDQVSPVVNDVRSPHGQDRVSRRAASCGQKPMRIDRDHPGHIRQQPSSHRHRCLSGVRPRTPGWIPVPVALYRPQHATNRKVELLTQLLGVTVTPLGPRLLPGIADPRFRLEKAVQWQPPREERSMIVGELETVFALDAGELRIGQSRRDLAATQLSQTTRGHHPQTDVLTSRHRGTLTRQDAAKTGMSSGQSQRPTRLSDSERRCEPPIIYGGRYGRERFVGTRQFEALFAKGIASKSNAAG